MEACEGRALLSSTVGEPFGSWRPIMSEVAGAVDPSPFPADWLVVSSTENDGQGTLRQALRDANAHPGLDTITFDLAGSPEGGAPTLRPLSALPAITDPVVIDGRSRDRATQGRPGLILDGLFAGPATDGLALVGGGSTVAGLMIVRFGGSGVVIVGQGANRVIASAIGTDLEGHAGLGNGQDGLSVRGSSSNLLGGSEPGEGNVVAGNGLVGVRLAGAGAASNVVAGNAIGVDPSGTKSLPNRAGGVFLDNAPGNTVGGTSTGAGNLISGNGGSGVVIAGQGASGNWLLGNRVGTDSSGLSAVGNAGDGVILDNAPGNIIGGTSGSFLSGNLVSGNEGTGVRLTGGGSSSNLLMGNLVGTDLTGSRALGNAFDGIFLDGAPRNLIGSASAGSGNLVSGNGGSGIQLFGPGASGNLVRGNVVGLDPSGRSALGNARDGVFLNGSPANQIGGARPGEGNVVSANGGTGIDLLDLDATGNNVSGNLVGTDATGKVGPGLGNAYGLVVNGAPGNTLGGALPNTVAGNRLGDFLTRNLEPPAPRPLSTIAGASVTTSGSTATAISLTIRGGLDPASAARISAYDVRLARPRRGSSPVVTLKAAAYDDATEVVTLTLARPLPATTPLVLSATGLTDPIGRPIEGAPGGTYTTNLVGRPTAPTPIARPRPTPPPRRPDRPSPRAR